ncbi:ATP-binding protein [Deinococcus sp.]|uniref:ATP-binding protein n=1 Tax=Deinococcus sp. TaxID=47478 RepID=UPI003B5B2D08
MTKPPITPELAPPRPQPWQRLPVSIIAAMLLMTLIMAVSFVAVSNYSVQRQFDNMPPEVRAQFERGNADGDTVLAQPGVVRPAAPPRPSKVERVRRELLGNLIWAVAISGVLAVLVGALLARLITRPVDAVSKAAQRVASGDLAARARQWPGNLELVNLTHNFNRMASSLDTLERERREMIADIAHELRTPLAVVQARLDAFEDGVLIPTSSEIALVSMQIGLLTRLVGDLRTLSLADTGRLPLQLAPLDLAALTTRIGQSFASRAQGADIALHLHTPAAELPVEGDRDRLGQVLINVLENALRYTPSGGQITVTARRADTRALLSVRDSGPGFPPGSEQQVFARFYRADQSRARDSGGSGLGLAIVAALVQAHGGQVRAAQAPSGGAEIEISLPLAEESGSSLDDSASKRPQQRGSPKLGAWPEA